MKFNGAYNCSGDNDVFKCKLSCPQGIEFDSTPAAEYVCLYEKGYFTPSPIPMCKYGNNIVLII